MGGNDLQLASNQVRHKGRTADQPKGISGLQTKITHMKNNKESNSRANKGHQKGNRMGKKFKKVTTI